VAMALSAPAHAQLVGQGKTNCWWESGIYACSSTYEDTYSRVDTICAAGLTEACSTKTYEKPRRPTAPPAVEHSSGGTIILRGGGG
jgi:hypothetical protein